MHNERQARNFSANDAVDPGQHYQLTTRHAHSDAVAAHASQNNLDTVDTATFLVVIACDHVPASVSCEMEGELRPMQCERKSLHGEACTQNRAAVQHTGERARARE